MSNIVPVEGKQIGLKFIELLRWARGGNLVIVTPFINDFDLRGKEFSARARDLVRQQTSLKLVAGPPSFHERHAYGKAKDCYRCAKAMEKIHLLDLYAEFGTEVLVKEDLHAKVYVGEDVHRNRKCLTGSVNLTKQALQKWHELGLYITDPKAIETILSFVTRWITGVRGERAQSIVEWKRKTFDQHSHLAELERAGI